MNMLHIMVQTYTLRVVQGTQSWMNEMGIELDSEGNDMCTALEVQRHLKTCLMEPAQLTCLLLMGGTVQSLTRALQRLGPLDSESPTGRRRPGTTGTGRGSTTTGGGGGGGVAQLVVVPLAMGRGAKSPGFDSHHGLSFQRGREDGWIGLNPPPGGSWIIAELCKWKIDSVA